MATAFQRSGNAMKKTTAMIIQMKDSVVSALSFYQESWFASELFDVYREKSMNCESLLIDFTHPSAKIRSSISNVMLQSIYIAPLLDKHSDVLPLQLLWTGNEYPRFSSVSKRVQDSEWCNVWMKLRAFLVQSLKCWQLWTSFICWMELRLQKSCFTVQKYRYYRMNIFCFVVIASYRTPGVPTEFCFWSLWIGVCITQSRNCK